ncbi:MAG TPA: SH3 domain-containing protein, partial [Caldilineaceae bacterium]|nr:SH3 domain-containing protein [Caldilineaceae bacterium]
MSKRRSTPLAAACLFLLSILLVQPQPLLAATVLGAYATVRTPLLNVRTGPSTDFPILDTVRAGETIAVIGRLADCSWL